VSASSSTSITLPLAAEERAMARSREIRTTSSALRRLLSSRAASMSWTADTVSDRATCRASAVARAGWNTTAIDSSRDWSGRTAVSMSTQPRPAAGEPTTGKAKRQSVVVAVP
jgi:hypothetical protein